MDKTPYEPWSFFKQFRLTARGYQKIIGFAWHLAVPLLVIFGIVCLVNIWIAPKKSIQNNQPQITVKDQGTAKVTNNYIQNKEAGAWEVGINGGAIRLGDENGGYAGVELKRRF